MNRYDRQERVRQIGHAGQQKISQSAIMIVGVGALGSYAAEQLVRAGIKKIILVDPDTVDITNLQRQSLFTEADAQQKRLKVEAVKEHLSKINSKCQIIASPAPLSADLIEEHQFNLCLDCLDNYQARDLLNKLAISGRFDYLFASCAGTYGNVMAISPINHPCLNCLFPNLEELKQNDCDLIGVNTALIPVVAGLQVSLALHYLVDKTQVNFNELITIDNWSMQFTKFKISKNHQCPTCTSPYHFEFNEPEQELHMLCGEDAFYTVKKETVDFKAIQKILARKKLLVSANQMFLHFKWYDRPVSIFKNGKIVMYNLPNLTIARQQLQSLNVLMKEDAK
ncbi:HesA/MoeB/ThiF family protein [Limosilactobacillus caviae]|uniref:Molybdopterin biosynthesis protein MoeB n=1 Tax=Limosilactobacillus caviae TaxID=1769424 RepID=A0ABQ2C5W3_9LACO|nr:HesA/MoeB/ThiF family protein [Limosilactobacillus caviae]MCD7123656.1 HesA/MoeB/ThiF family protein [Limosilactobacillus caviae]MRH45729.1 HesA/MoeB/ThiF family protein [Limosilactobacillus reuteri]GGI63098.1 molybdopterin biosynthesis protein MoeB [Limosilactobacillus caviae]